ncbi:unnamed protein product [Dovyalis caffra]|uniref:Uncharacterized protein n=1 Tax=Dovyalis caffra TaxID=77055 RepID=A0AAV1R586_9ROSI|nr:unnamed protein product [Dovyalis caffra]
MVQKSKKLLPVDWLPGSGGEIGRKVKEKSSAKGKLHPRIGTGKGRTGSVRANTARVGINGGVSTSITDADKSGLAGLTTDQWQRPVEMLE